MNSQDSSTLLPLYFFQVRVCTGLVQRSREGLRAAPPRCHRRASEEEWRLLSTSEASVLFFLKSSSLSHTHAHTYALIHSLRAPSGGQSGGRGKGTNSDGAGGWGGRPGREKAEMAGRQIPPPDKPVISRRIPAGWSLLRLLGAARTPAGAHAGLFLPLLAF